VECLHTILLGPYKYLWTELMERLQPQDKREIEARAAAFPRSGLPYQIVNTSICKYYNSFLGCDWKVLAQECLFLIWDHLTASE